MKTYYDFMHGQKLFKYLSPSEFLTLLKTDKLSIKRSRFIPPRLGDKNLGKILVEYNYVPAPKSERKSKLATAK